MKNEHEYRCYLCGGTFAGYGNNPAPLEESGVCCDGCNAAEVIPARIRSSVSPETREKSSFRVLRRTHSIS